MNSDQLGGIVRAVLAAGGGMLVADGLIDNGTMTTVAGGLTTIIVALWSHYSNRPAAS